MRPDRGSTDGSIFPERLITGFQPVHALHLGHLVGAVRPCLWFQDLNPGECFVLIADLHVLTGQPDTSRVQRANHITVRSLLSLGIDPEKCVIFRQSDVPEICQLMWTLSCYVGKGVLERGHAYKAAAEAGRSVQVGLFLYPLLQAADILSVRATRVPAGPDQQRHTELARSIARRMNSLGDSDVLPEPSLADPGAELLRGTDGTRKMSLQHGNIISIFEEEMVVAGQINSIASLPAAAGTPVSPEDVPAFLFLSLLAPPEITDQARKAIADGSLGMAELKDLVFRNFIGYFEAARQRYHELGSETSLIRDVLADGALRARQEASETLAFVRDLVGY